jgi:hypothetical protein
MINSIKIDIQGESVCALLSTIFASRDLNSAVTMEFGRKFQNFLVGLN